MELRHRRTDLRRKLVEAVVRGEKTATASLGDEYAPDTDQTMPQVGERLVAGRLAEVSQEWGGFEYGMLSPA